MHLSKPRHQALRGAIASSAKALQKAGPRDHVFPGAKAEPLDNFLLQLHPILEAPSGEWSLGLRFIDFVHSDACDHSNIFHYATVVCYNLCIQLSWIAYGVCIRFLLA